jgi:adenylate cyclase
VLVDILDRQGGIVNKFLGDGFLALFGAPLEASDAAHRAVAAGREMLTAMDHINAQTSWPLRIGIGIHLGEVVAGNVGSPRRKEYTVIGDTVNFASRLEGAGKAYGTHVLISEATQRLAADAIETREIDTVLVVGKSEPERIFELLGRKGEVSAQRLQLREVFEAALVAYRKQAWEDAEAGFGKCLDLDAADGPSRVFLARVAHFREQPPSPDWNGTWTLETK